jgi:hypothetical protein
MSICSRAGKWLIPRPFRRQLGGEIPNSITIRCPSLEARVEFPIPAVDFATGNEGWRTFTRDRVIENCRKQMIGIPDWDTLVEGPIRQGERLELCWRSGSKLDWVWLEQDEEGRDRPWAVLWGVASTHVSVTFCGVAEVSSFYLLKPRVQSDLELRIAEHTPTKLVLRDGSTLREPPALEGYLYRYRQDTHLRDPVYVATHDGNIFFVPVASANPPPPPTLPINPANPIPLPDPGQYTDIATSTSASVHSTHSAATPLLTRAGEVARGAAQILVAKSFLDMRNIVEVRRATEPWLPAMPGASILGGTERKRRTVSQGTDARSQASRSMHSTPHIPGTTDDDGGHLEEIGDMQVDDEDGKDMGGDEVLNAIADLGARNALKMRRSFEVVLRTGEIIRFEVSTVFSIVPPKKSISIILLGVQLQSRR